MVYLQQNEHIDLKHRRLRITDMRETFNKLSEISKQTPVRTREGEILGNWVDVAGMQIYYRSAGDTGPFLLLIHGGGSDHSGFAWKYAIRAFSNDFRVIAVDLPGYGKSQQPNWHFAETDGPANSAGRNPFLFHINFINDFLAALKINKAHLLGISMGGGIVLGFSLKHPERVEKLILVNSYGLGNHVIGGIFTYVVTRPTSASNFIRFALRISRSLVKAGLRWSVYDRDKITDELIDDAWLAIRQTKTHPTWRDFQKHEITFTGFRTTFLAELPKLKIPTLIIHSRNDQLIPAKYSKRAADRIPNVELCILENMGHLVPRESRETFHETVFDFLK